MVKGRDEHLRECYFVHSNEPLVVGTLTASAGTGPALSRPKSQVGLTSSIAEGGRTTACFLTAVYVQNYSAECIVVKYTQIFFSSPTVRYLFVLKIIL